MVNGDDDHTTSLHIPQEGEHRLWDMFHTLLSITTAIALAASSDSEAQAKELEYDRGPGAYLCIYLCCSLPTEIASRTSSRTFFIPWFPVALVRPHPCPHRDPLEIPTGRPPSCPHSSVLTLIPFMEFLIYNHPWLSSTLLEMNPG
jgi:hypothetical protein